MTKDVQLKVVGWHEGQDVALVRFSVTFDMAGKDVAEVQSDRDKLVAAYLALCAAVMRGDHG